MINYIETHPSTLSLVEVEDRTTYITYTLTYQLRANTADQLVICLIIIDRGQPGEAVYFKGRIPYQYRPESTLQEEVETEVATYQTTHPELEYYRIEHVDATEKISLVTGYIYDSGAGESHKEDYILIKENGTWKFRKIV